MKKSMAIILLMLMIMIFVVPTQACKNGETQTTAVIEEEKIGVVNLEITPSKVKSFDKVSIKSDVMNITNVVLQDYVVPLLVNGILADRKSITFSPGEVVRVEFSLETNKAGLYTVSVGDKESLLEVHDPVSASFQISNFVITPAICKISDQVVVTASILNVGELAGKYNADLKMDGKTVQTIQVDVPAGSTSEAVFRITPDSPGKYVVGVGDKKVTLEVQAPLPATFKLLKLEVKPVECFTTDNVVITADITNDGELPGKYVAELKLNGVTVQKYETAIIQPGASSFVVFKIPAGTSGKYIASVGNLSGQLTVVQAPSPVQLPGVVCPPTQIYNPTTKC